MNKERLRQIFIEEANEIIEALDVEVINFEEDPGNKDILNEIFRGVHTLKGSSNSFGFTRLGEYVHHFEDLLDYYRNNDVDISANIIDLFLDAVDVIKEMLRYEIEEQSGFPENYEQTLELIRQLLSGESTPQATTNEPVKEESEEISDLSDEFGDVEIASSLPSEEEMLSSLDENEVLFKITLKLDEQVYIRGMDHAICLILLSQLGRPLYAHWDFTKVPALDAFNPDHSYIGPVSLYLASKSEKHDIEESFENLDASEYQIDLITKTAVPSTPPVATTPPPTPPTPEVKPAVSTTPSPSAPASKKPAKEKEKEKEEKRSFVKIDTLKLDELFASVGELVIAQNFLTENEVIKEIENENVSKTLEQLSKITRLIQNRVMALRMVQIRDTFDKMKRVVRDASRKVNKEITLHTSGEDTEIDKTMVDQLSDPLIHLIRNAIDHGIEPDPNDRLNAGKESKGNVHLMAYHRGGNIVIEIKDDGRGINRDVVLNKAIERGLYEGDGSELSDQQVYSFIMQAGFSTAAVISDISGRGVGLDVVRNFIETLRGKIEIDSELGKGSTFRILLPLTLAIIDGMLVKSGNETFIIPTLSISESFRPNQEIVHYAQGKGEFVNLREELLPIVRLNRKLELNEQMPKVWESTLVTVETEGGKFAILVDDLIGRQQVVIKTLGKSFSKIKEISGGAVMGNGDIALILNIEELVS